MTKQPKLKSRLLGLLICLAGIAHDVQAAENANKNTAKPGYSVDGRTSASVLAAKRSHEVAREDEVGLSVFSGLFAIAVIGFFTHQYFNKK